jgi:hypothetical protein
MTTSPITTRLPRYRRAGADVTCVLTARDLEIMRLVESFRLASSEQIQLLVEGSDQGILRRLQALFHAGYLDRLRRQYVPGGGSAKMIYAITNKGVTTLQQAGLIDKATQTDRNAQNRELHDFSIAHRLLVSHIRAVLTAACANRPDVGFVFWREGRELFDTIEVTLPQKYATFPIAPDGFFAIQNAQGRRLHLMVEADRGSMNLERFTRKLQAYAAYGRAGKHTEKFGIKHFRVLTVTTSPARCQNLIAAAAAGADIRKDGRMFLFATEERLPLLEPAKIFDKIWTMPGVSAPCSILG